MGGNTRAPENRLGVATCVDDGGYAVSLVVGRSYGVLPDAAGEAMGWMRVIDESGEDYLFPAVLFAWTNRGAEPREG